MTNPFDALEIARDLTRRDEVEHLFAKIKDEQGHWDRTSELGHPHGSEEYDRGVIHGLELALDILDGRIGHLRDRWG